MLRPRSILFHFCLIWAAHIRAQNCSASCHVLPPEPSILKWLPLEFSTTITAATVLYYVDEQNKTVSSVTKTVELPEGYTLPPRNDDGTAVTTVTRPRGRDSDFTTAM